jgi:hypothetical protein
MNNVKHIYIYIYIYIYCFLKILIKGVLMIIYIVRCNSAGSIQSDECECETCLPRELLVRPVHDLWLFRPEA